MIGIGVAVDYSLFVLARFREGVRAGTDTDRARTRAMSTSGVAVAFSGMTVILFARRPVVEDRCGRGVRSVRRRGPEAAFSVRCRE
jgi:MMPL family